MAEPELGVGEITLGLISGDTMVRDARNGSASASASAALLSAVQSKASDSVSAAELDGPSGPLHDPGSNLSASIASSEMSTAPLPPPRCQTPLSGSAVLSVASPSAGTSTSTSTTQAPTTKDTIACPSSPVAPIVLTDVPVEVHLQPPTPAMGSEAIFSSSTSAPSTVAGPSTPPCSGTGSPPLAHDFLTPNADLASYTTSTKPPWRSKSTPSTSSTPSSPPNPPQSRILTPKMRRTWFSPRGATSSSPVRGSSTPASPPKPTSSPKSTRTLSSIPRLRVSRLHANPPRQRLWPRLRQASPPRARATAVVTTGVITPTPVPATSTTVPTAASQLALALAPPSESSSPAPAPLVSAPSTSTTFLAPQEDPVPRPATPPPGYPAPAAPLVHSPTSYSSPTVSASSSTSQVPTPRPNAAIAAGKEEDERPPVYVASSRTRTPAVCIYYISVNGDPREEILRPED